MPAVRGRPHPQGGGAGLRSRAIADVGENDPSQWAPGPTPSGARQTEKIIYDRSTTNEEDKRRQR
jgi:hypothetical protein